MYVLQKVQEKNQVIALRKRGYTYREILQKVPVSKSSISLWLRGTPLTKNEKEILKDRTDKNISRGRVRAASSLSQKRKERDQIVLREAKKEFAVHCKEPLFHVGLSLYWAEGAKRNTRMFAFSNSDVAMVNIMLDWMQKYLGLSRDEIFARLYIHKPYANERCEEFWSTKTRIPLKNFKKTVYKPTGLLVKKRPGYKGCVRIEYGKTASFRKLQFWLRMLIEYYEKER